MDDDGRVTLAVPCRTDEPDLGGTLAAFWEGWRTTSATAGRALDCIVCLNGPPGGPGGSGRALADVRAFAARLGLPFEVTAVEEGSVPRLPTARAVRVLTTGRRGKAVAWNLLRAAAATRVAIFLDADVRAGSDTPARLLGALAARPTAVLATPRTTCAPRPTVFERVMAAPYGVSFPNLSGQLYAARLAGLPPAMPEDLLEPERWLELVVGCDHVVRAPDATVVVRLPATLREFFRQRVRIEMGKVQLAREYPTLAARSAPQPRAGGALAALRSADLARLGVYLVLRELAHGIAWWRYRRGRTTDVWVQAASTKEWQAPS